MSSAAETHDQAISVLVEGDVRLHRQVVAHGAPAAFRRPPSFATLVLLILEQQVSLDSAAAAFGRLTDRLGSVTPDAVLGLDDTAMLEIGFSRQKSRYARELAMRLGDGRLDLDSLTALDDEAVRIRLTEIPGIGPWTADVFLMSCLGRPDVWPVGDRALQVATAEALDLDSVPTPRELETIGERWSPWRSTAAQILWHGYLVRRGRSVPTSSLG